MYARPTATTSYSTSAQREDGHSLSTTGPTIDPLRCL